MNTTETSDADDAPPGLPIFFSPPRLSELELLTLAEIAEKSQTIAPALCRWLFVVTVLEDARRDSADSALIEPAFPAIITVGWTGPELADALYLALAMADPRRRHTRPIRALFMALARIIAVDVHGRLSRPRDGA